MWILTYEVNAYDQYGEYFVCAWNREVTAEDIKTALNSHNSSLGASDDDIKHILAGGGRISTEWEWYNLKRVTDGET